MDSHYYDFRAHHDMSFWIGAIGAIGACGCKARWLLTTIKEFKMEMCIKHIIKRHFRPFWWWHFPAPFLGRFWSRSLWGPLATSQRLKIRGNHPRSVSKGLPTAEAPGNIVFHVFLIFFVKLKNVLPFFFFGFSHFGLLDLGLWAYPPPGVLVF